MSYGGRGALYGVHHGGLTAVYLAGASARRRRKGVERERAREKARERERERERESEEESERVEDREDRISRVQRAEGIYTR